MAEDLQEQTAIETDASSSGDRIGRLEVGGIFFLPDQGKVRVQIQSCLGRGGEGRAFLARIVDGPERGRELVVKAYNPDLFHLVRDAHDSHELREGALNNISSERLARYHVTPTGLIVFLTYVPGQNLATYLEQPGMLFLDRLRSGEGLIGSSFSTVHAMHEAGVTHPDLCAQNIVVGRGAATVIDITRLSEIGGSMVYDVRLLNSHPDLFSRERVEVHPKYAAHALGMMVLTAGIPDGVRGEYMMTNWEDHDLYEIAKAKREGDFVRIDLNNFMDVAGRAVRIFALNSSDHQEATARLADRFRLGLALTGPDEDAHEAALANPVAFLRAAA